MEDPLPAVDVQRSVQTGLLEMGFVEADIQRALNSLGTQEANLETVLQVLLASHEEGVEALSQRVVGVIEIDEQAGGEPPAKRARIDVNGDNSGQASAALSRKLSSRSQDCYSRVISRHSGIKHASLAKLLLRCSFAKSQGLLDNDQCQDLHRSLEGGQVDTVHEILTGLGVKSRPDMPIEDGEEPWECPICFSAQEERGWKCPAGHRYCTTCMRQHASSTARPKCPTVGCGAPLEESDLQELQVAKDVLDGFKERKLQGAIDALATADATAGGSSSSTAQPRGGESVIRCPNEKCGNIVLVPSETRQCFACTCGTPAFCTRCRHSPYHFHGKCEEVQALRERWLAWVSGGREAYSGDAAKSAAFEKQAQALREGMDRQRDLEQDEEWKAKHCRECPKCRRPVQKLSGCDSMVCGADSHGGNDQPGCGHNFEWSQAAAYKAAASSSELPKLTTEQINCRGRDLLHAFVDCTLCGSEGKGIRGPRFRCLHCESFDVCSNCEKHLGEVHFLDHVFEILFEPDFEWGSIGWLPSGTRVRLRRRGEELPRTLDGSGPASLEGLCGTVAKNYVPVRPDHLEPRPAFARYQFGGDRGRWHEYDAVANAAIKAAVQAGDAQVRFASGGRQYVVDLRTMRQRNMTTGGSRPVQGVQQLLSPEDEAADRAQKRRYEESCKVALDTGGDVVIEMKYVEPILASRGEAEDLMSKATEKKERGGSPPPPVRRPGPEEEGEDGEEEEEEEEDWDD
mmetsp:Transcript_6043/g.14442  ORF Transcript_6043/g.14442 Transcript_6043/m.14442 type:complete len:742 (-) Transcript_6043:364-2589(-)